METTFGFQPDIEDDEILFGPVENFNLSFAHNRTVVMHHSESDGECTEIFEPSWNVFERESGYISGKNTNALEPIISDFEEHASNASSVMDSAFIDDGEIESRSSQNSNHDESHSSQKFRHWEQNSRNSEALQRIENRLQNFRKKFNLNSAVIDRTYYEDCSTEASENQNPSCCYSECESGTQLGDRTMAFVKEMKASTGNGHEGVPAILTTDLRRKAVNLKPMLNDHESLDRLTSTPLVIKHLRPMTLSAKRSAATGTKNTLGHNLPSVSVSTGMIQNLENTEKKTNSKKGPFLSSEPVVVKRALNFQVQMK